MNKTQRQKAAERIQKAHDEDATMRINEVLDNRPHTRWLVKRMHHDRAELLTLLADAERENDMFLGLLSVAKCPNCDGSGAYMTAMGAAQCQWCGEKDELLNKQESE